MVDCRLCETRNAHKVPPEGVVSAKHELCGSACCGRLTVVGRLVFTAEFDVRTVEKSWMSKNGLYPFLE